MAEYRKREESGKPQVNLVVIGECLLVWGVVSDDCGFGLSGHVDAGKSTLMGHLLFLKGQVSKRTLHK